MAKRCYVTSHLLSFSFPTLEWNEMKILQLQDPNIDTDAVTHLCPSVLNYVAGESDEV